MFQNNYLHYLIPEINKRIHFYKTSKRFFMARVLYTETATSNKHKNSFFKKYNATENSYIIFNSGDKQGDFSYSCLIFFILRQMTDRDNYPVEIIGKLPNGKEIYMPKDYKEYVEMARDVVAIKTSFVVGEERVKYKFSVDNFMNIVKVSIPIYHPDTLTSANIFGLLNQRINTAIRYLDFFEEIC